MQVLTRLTTLRPFAFAVAFAVFEIVLKSALARQESCIVMYVQKL